MPSARFWIAIRLLISSRSRFVNTGATKLLHRFCTDQFRLRRSCLKKRRRFAASEEPQHIVIFQGLEGLKPTTIRDNRGEVEESHVNNQTLYKQKTRHPGYPARCDPAANCAKRFRIGSAGEARTRS